MTDPSPLPTPEYIQERLLVLAPDIRMEHVADIAAVIANQLLRERRAPADSDITAAVAGYRLRWPRWFLSEAEFGLLQLSDVPRTPPIPQKRRKPPVINFNPMRKKVRKNGFQ